EQRHEQGTDKADAEHSPEVTRPGRNGFGLRGSGLSGGGTVMSSIVAWSQSGFRNTEGSFFILRPVSRYDHCRIGCGTLHCSLQASMRKPKAAAAMISEVTPPSSPVTSARIVRPDPNRAGMR